MNNIKVICEDITRLDIDAIVNAANASLCGGGGVDGAIHRAAGKDLLGLCRTLGGCDTGKAKITPGFNLPAKHIIHTVGPVWYGGHKREEELLASCYQECLTLAVENKVKSVAFPAISCGSYRFPIDKACEIAVREVLKLLSENKFSLEVIFVCFDEKTKSAYSKALDRVNYSIN